MAAEALFEAVPKAASVSLDNIVVNLDEPFLIDFELPKLPQTVTANNGLELWLSLSD